MQKLSLILIIIMFLGASVNAQDCKMFFPSEKGTEMTMKSYNGKDKLTGSTINKILDKQVDGNKIKVIFSSRSLDEKGKETGNGQMEVKCEDGVFYIDMKNFLDDQMMEAYKDMQVEIETNNAMQFPGSIDIGMPLPDANILIKISNQGIPMFTLSVNITNRKIESKETITTPAGSYECYKMSYDVETKTMMTVKTKGIDWFTENVGTVRSESLDKNGKLMGYTVLESIK
jgi:hypothetical protein